jgi:hypothetical protein
MELAESTELRHKANRDLELAVPSSESVLQECQRLRMSLDAEVASHERTKASLGVVQHALADMTLARRQSEEARTTAAASSSIRKQQLELASLRENNIDLSEQVQVPLPALPLHWIATHCIAWHFIAWHYIALYLIVSFCILPCVKEGLKGPNLKTFSIVSIFLYYSLYLSVSLSVTQYLYLYIRIDVKCGTCLLLTLCMLCLIT